MNDMQAHLETLRKNIAECERLQKRQKGKIKRDIFRSVAAHYRVLAGELEKAVTEASVRAYSRLAASFSERS